VRCLARWCPSIVASHAEQPQDSLDRLVKVRRGNLHRGAAPCPSGSRQPSGFSDSTHARVARPSKDMAIDARYSGAYDLGRPTPNIPLTAADAKREGR
jgi:hypothetical protein